SQDDTLAGSFAREALAAHDLPIDARVNALHVLLQGHLRRDHVKEAMALAEKLTRLRRVADDWGVLGACYLAIDQPGKARQAFKQALQIDPFRHRLHAGLAETLHRLGNWPLAKEEDEKAQWLLKLNPEP